jgi:glutaredoxin
MDAARGVAEPNPVPSEATMNLLPASPAKSRATRVARSLALAALLGGAAVGALAQYKVVGPDGRVTYTDKPPTPADIKVNNGGTAAAAPAAGLPYETRQAMGRYPVAVYTTAACPACDALRSYLKSHAIPFNEFTVLTDSDRQAAQARFGGNTLPVTTVGSQRLVAFNPQELQSYLDAAGYPKQARLVGYNWPAPAPLTPPRSSPTQASTDAPPAPAAPALPPPSKDGIQF